MTSKKIYLDAYVWIWLPGETKPVVAGKLTQEGLAIVFNYGQSYLDRNNKISIYEPELPLQSGFLPLLSGLNIPGCIRDGSPDAWGRRVIINRKFGTVGPSIDKIQLDELTYLLESGSDRIGALDFQVSPTEYQPRYQGNATLEELLESAERVEKGVPLTSELDRALFHGSPIGGARPKALIDDPKLTKKYIAKFSSTSDLYNVIKAEFVAMKLAEIAGINVAPVYLEESAGRDVLLIERFDRIYTTKGWQRKCMVSALTLFGLDEMMARYASYEQFSEIIRHRFYDSSKTLKELYSRMVFNILVGNTDDHARNHAAFWDGEMLSLSPAYDICPQSRAGGEASQAMIISGENRMSQIQVCINAASNFLLSREEAVSLVENLINCVSENWMQVCEGAKLSKVDQKLFSNHQFFNSYAFENLKPDCQHLQKLALESPLKWA